MSWDTFAGIVFWVSVAALIYTYAGYPALILVSGKLNRKRKKSSQTELPWRLPSVSVVIVVYNEGKRIRERIQNLIDSDYPLELLEIVTVSDGSTDNTADEVKAISYPRLKFIEQGQRLGKASGINIGVKNASGEIVVFTDARQRFDKESIRYLVNHFREPEIGAVSGSLEIDPASTAVGKGVDIYWRIEKLIRENEALIDSCIGCTGAIYAIRRELFEPLPPDTILDDVVCPMKIVVKGYRVVFDPQARAFDPQPLEPAKEKTRKQRTLAGNFQMLFRYPEWLAPWRNRVWWQLISHKYLRLSGPYLMIMIFVSNLFLLSQPFYQLTFWGQVLLYLLAMIGFLVRDSRHKLFSVPAGFVFLNYQALRAFFYYLKNKNSGAWSTVMERTD